MGPRPQEGDAAPPRPAGRRRPKGSPGPSPGGRPRLRRALALVLLLSVAGACGREAGRSAAVSGKTVYRGMAVEQVAVRAVRRSQGGEEEAGTARSGYHGSFVLRLPPGRYRIEASGTIPRGPGDVLLKGVVEDLEVPEGASRVDRVVVTLAPSADAPGGAPP